MAIEELENEGEVFVTRTLKDGQMRMVFWNEVKAEKAPSGEDVPVQAEGTDGNGTGLAVEKGELSNTAMNVPQLNSSKEFYDLWHSLKVPNEVARVE